MPRLKHKHITRIFLLSTLTVVALWAAWNQLHSHATQHLHHEPPNFDTEPTNASTLSALDEPTNFTRPTFHPDLLPFWSNLSAVLEDTKPSVPLPSKPIEALINGFASLGSSFNFRQDLVELSQKDVDILQNDHSRFVAQLPALAPQLPYENGTRGIVTAAAGSFVPVLVTSLRMLRKTGSKLPVEVFMESEAVYEKEICEEVLRELGAKCFVMSEVLDQVESQMVISKYQMKAFAVLFSSFDEVLLLDADEIAVVAPEELLDGVVFGEKGFVSWPDYVGSFPFRFMERVWHWWRWRPPERAQAIHRCLFSPPPLLPTIFTSERLTLLPVGQHSISEILPDLLTTNPLNLHPRLFRIRPTSLFQIQTCLHPLTHTLLQRLRPLPLLYPPLARRRRPRR